MRHDPPLPIALRLAAGMLITVAALLSGCSAGQHGTANMAVRPIDSGRGKIALNARDTVYVMLRAGFTREQILELGPKLRNTLAQRGGARITRRHRTRATFLARDDELYGMASQGGPFLYRPQGNRSGDAKPSDTDDDRDPTKAGRKSALPGDEERSSSWRELLQEARRNESGGSSDPNRNNNKPRSPDNKSMPQEAANQPSGQTGSTADRPTGDDRTDARSDYAGTEKQG